MNRRDVLRYAALGTGTAVFAPLASAVLSGCGPAAVEDAYQPILFTPSQFDLVKQVMDVILPRTDTPSATDASVHITADKMVGEVYAEEDRQTYLSGIAQLESWLADNGFDDADARLGLLRKIEDGDIPKGVLDAYLHLKQQVISFYLTSELIAENHLNYLPVPGAYEPCITLEEAGGKLWAI